MNTDIINNRDFSSEFTFTTSRSSGPGGQNVNKVNTKVELRFHVNNSTLLTDLEKIKINEKLTTKITLDGYLIVVSQSERTQLKNKKNAIEKFYKLIERALKPKRKRIPTKPSYSSKLERLKEKKITSEKKDLRKKIE